MKYIMMSFLIAAAIGCNNRFHAVGGDPRSVHGIDPAFQSQVALFESLYGTSIGDIPIGFSTMNDGVVGLCSIWSSGHRQIQVDRDYWNSTPPESRIGLIFHELGHCLLNREHVNSLKYYSGTHIRGEVPVSLMYPYNFYSSSYSELESYYFGELFNPTTLYSSDHSLALMDDDVVFIDNTTTEINNQYKKEIL